jgi:hypothetical protein
VIIREIIANHNKAQQELKPLEIQHLLRFMLSP